MDMPHHDTLRDADDGLSDTGYFTIGEFSKLARLSARMLRHYDERGILTPAQIDPSSGYRYYSVDQLEDATRIAQLRDVGFPVAAIAAVLPVFDDPAALGRALDAQRSQLVGEANTVATRIGGVDRLLARISQPQEFTMSTPTVTRVTKPAHTVAYLRDTIPTYADEGALWERFMPLFEKSGAVYSPAMGCGATFHDPDYRESDVDVEIWIDVAAPFTPPSDAADGAGRFGCRTMPEQDALVATLVGDYSGVAAVSAELGRAMAEQGLTMSGPMFNIYVSGPAEESDPAKWVTECYLPVG